MNTLKSVFVKVFGWLLPARTQVVEKPGVALVSGPDAPDPDGKPLDPVRMAILDEAADYAETLLKMPVARLPEESFSLYKRRQKITAKLLRMKKRGYY